MQRVQPADVRPYLDLPLKAALPPGQANAGSAPAAPPPAAAAPGVARPALQKPDERPNSAWTAALAFSAAWTCVLLAWTAGMAGPDGLFNLSPQWLSVLVVAAVMPVALALMAAHVLTEAWRLRRQSVALATTTQLLLTPDETAAQKVGHLGRSIKRELDMFNGAMEAAAQRMTAIETAANERLALIERTVAAAQERVEKATTKLGSEREKLAQFAQALDSVVLSASETLTTRLQDARAAVRSASESLHAEHGAIASLVTTLQTASQAVSTKALETSQELERQAQRLDSASEAAAARSEQVLTRHERQRAAFAETIDRLKQENDHMARALDYQREGMNKLVMAMAEESRKIGAFTAEGARRLDEVAGTMAQRIVETTQLFGREAEKLKTSSELTTAGLEQAMQTIRRAGDSSFDAAGRLGSVLIGLRDTSTSSLQQIEGAVGRLSKMLGDMPTEAASHVKLLSQMIDEQARAMHDLNARLASAFDRVQGIELARPAVAPVAAVDRQPLPQPEREVPSLAARPAPVLQPRPQPQPAPQPPPQTLPDPLPASVAGYSQNRPPAQTLAADRSAPPPAEGRSWFGLRRPGRADDMAAPADERGNWDMKSLLAAIETKDTPVARPAQPAPPAPNLPRFLGDAQEIQQIEQGGTADAGRRMAGAPQRAETNPARGPAAMSARHMVETLQAMAIDLCRFLEDDPPHDLLKRYRNGERNVFIRRLASVLGSEHLPLIGAKHQTDREFRDVVERYIAQFEALLELAAKTEGDNSVVDSYLTSQTGKVYLTLGTAIGHIT